jgi:hypothetical protein
LTVAMSMSPADAQAADPKAPAGDARAIAAGTVAILPFTICQGCPLPVVLAGMQIDSGDIAQVHAALGRKLDAERYAGANAGRATMTQVAGKPPRLDILELYGPKGLVAQAVRVGDGSYEVALRQPKPDGAPPPPTWGTKIETDPADGSQVVILATRSLGSLTEGTSDDLPGILSLRCMRGRFSAVISWPRFLGLRKGQTLQWRLDATPPVSDYWAISTDGRALLGPWSLPFLKRLYSAKQLAVSVTPYGMSASQSLTFRLDGLEAEAASLREACPGK